MTRAGIALGSNVGNRLQHLQTARAMIAESPHVRQPILASAVYDTAPIGCVSGTRNFLNSALEIGYDAEALTLLRTLREIESILGRSPTHERNAPRTVDLDLLYFGGLEMTNPELKVPHPRML